MALKRGEICSATLMSGHFVDWIGSAAARLRPVSFF